jgi:hypothetical protein
MITVAFDIDDTLYKVIDEGPIPEYEFKPGKMATLPDAPHKFHQALDYEMINLLRWYQKNGDRVIVWSAGGVDYARSFINKFGLQEDGPIEILEKKRWVHVYDEPKKGKDSEILVDICYDDQEVNLAKVNIRVRR